MMAAKTNSPVNQMLFREIPSLDLTHGNRNEKTKETMEKKKKALEPILTA
jgi:hypothetical protein